MIVIPPAKAKGKRTMAREVGHEMEMEQEGRAVIANLTRQAHQGRLFQKAKIPAQTRWLAKLQRSNPFSDAFSQFYRR